MRGNKLTFKPLFDSSGFFFFFFLFYAFSRRWFFYDWVAFKKFSSSQFEPWILSAILGGILTAITIFFLNHPSGRNLVKRFFQSIEKPSSGRWIFWIICLALVFRIFLLIQISSHVPLGFDEKTRILSQFCVNMGHQLANENGYTWNSDPVTIRPVGFPFLIAVFISLFGSENSGAIVHLNILFSAGIVFCSYGIARLLFSELIGRLTSLLAVFSWPEIALAIEILEEVAFTFLFLLIIYLLLTRKNLLLFSLSFLFLSIGWVLSHYPLNPQIVLAILLWSLIAFLGFHFVHYRHAIGVGILLGLTGYLRPVLVLFPLLMPSIYRLSGCSWKKSLKQSIVALVIMFATWSPWCLRNTIFLKTPTLLSTNGGATFFEKYRHIFTKDPEFLKYKEMDSELVLLYRKVAYNRTDIPFLPPGFNPSLVDKELGRYAMRTLIKYPWEATKLIIMKIVRFCFNAHQVWVKFYYRDLLQMDLLKLPRFWSQYFLMQFLNVTSYIFVVLFFGIGVYQTLRRGNRKTWIGLVPLLYMFMFLITMDVLFRYRISVFGLIYPYASFGWVSRYDSTQY